MEISGSDQQDQKLHLKRNIETLTCELERVETELWKEPQDILLEQIAEIIIINAPDWSRTATELSENYQFHYEKTERQRRSAVQ